MSDLPTRDEPFDLWESQSHKMRAAKVIRAYTNRDLLTREEAASDPKVRASVFAEYGFHEVLRRANGDIVLKEVSDDG